MIAFMSWSFDEFAENAQHGGTDEGIADDFETIAKRTHVHDGRARVLAGYTSKRAADDRYE